MSDEISRRRLVPGDRGELPSARHGSPAGFARRYDEGDLEAADTTLLDILRVLRRWWLLILGAMAVGGAIAAYRSYTAAPSYRAGAVIRLKDTQKALTGLSDPMQPNFGNRIDALISLLEVMRTELVLGDAVDRSSLRFRDGRTGAPPGFLTNVEVHKDAPRDTLHFRFTEASYTVTHAGGEVTGQYGVPVDLETARFTVDAPPESSHVVLTLLPRQSVLSMVRVGLTARARTSTDVVDVQYTSGNPVLAQRVVNEVVEAFHRNSIRMSRQQAQMRRTFLEEQLRQAETAHMAAQGALSRFRSRENLYSSASRMSAEQSGLHTVEMRRGELLAERSTYVAILRELESSAVVDGSWISTLVGASRIASNPTFSPLLSQLIRYETERQELLAGETGVRPGHPDVVRLDSLIARTQERMIGITRSQLDAVDAQIRQLTELEGQRADQMRQLPDMEALEARLVQQEEVTRRLSQSLEEELQRARIAEAVETGQVEILELARRPGAVAGRPAYLIIGMGLILGLLFGTGSAFLLEKVNTSVRREAELGRLVSAPGLAVIPRIPSTNGRTWLGIPLPRVWTAVTGKMPSTGANGSASAMQGGVGAIVRDASPSAEAFRTLRTSLSFSPTTPALKSFVVTSAMPQEGKTTVAANLALAYAHQGVSVLLIDGDLRRARQHTLFEVPQAPGLSDLLLGHAVAAETIHATGIKRLMVMPTGTPIPHPADLLAGKRLEQLLEALPSRFEMVILDTPPLLAVADAAILARRTDGALIVIHAGRTDRETIHAAIQKLSGVGARVLGAVLNDPNGRLRRHSSYYSYAYTQDGGRA